MSFLMFIPRLQVDGSKKAFPDDNPLWTIHLLTSEGLPHIATTASMASAQPVVLRQRHHLALKITMSIFRFKKSLRSFCAVTDSTRKKSAKHL